MKSFAAPLLAWFDRAGRKHVGGMTLQELAAEYGVSAERIRQIEVAAMKKMKKALASYA